MTWSPRAGIGLKKRMEGAEFHYDGLTQHITSEILKDDKLNNNLKHKRLKALMKNVADNLHLNIVRVLENQKNPWWNSEGEENGRWWNPSKSNTTNCKIPTISTTAAKNNKSPNPTPPAHTRPLSEDYLAKTQRQSKQMRKVIQYPVFCPKDKMDTKQKKNSKQLDSALLVTRRINRLPWRADEIKIHAGPYL